MKILLSSINNDNDNASLVFDFFKKNSILEILLSTLSRLTDNEEPEVKFTEFEIRDCENSLKKTYTVLIIEVY